MRTRLPQLTLALLAAFAPIALTRAADPAAAPDTKTLAVTLKVGDPAPKLQTGKWVQGEPVQARSTASTLTSLSSGPPGAGRAKPPSRT